jgi:hypothetical protein
MFKINREIFKISREEKLPIETFGEEYKGFQKRITQLFLT